MSDATLTFGGLDLMGDTFYALADGFSPGSPAVVVEALARQLMDGEIVKGVPGLLTLFSDGGWDDREKLTWLFTADDSLPGRPIDALRENRGAEVKRRAQALAF